MTTELLRELVRVQALFQARAIAAAMGLPQPTELPTTTAAKGAGR